MHVNVGIVGLNRISASLGLALKRYQQQPRAEHTFTILGSDREAHAMKTAQQIGAVDHFDRKLLKATENADVIFLNPSPAELEDTYARLGPSLKAGAVVLDLSELKTPSLRWAKQYFAKNASGKARAYLVGMTPIVSAEGLYVADHEVEAASADLLDGAEIILTPDPACPPEAIALAEDLVRLVGGTARFMDPLEHDGLLAATEQLPALLGTALFYTLHQSEGWTELRRMVNPPLAVATQQFRYTSPQDLQAIFTHNRQNIARHLENFIGVLEEIHGALETGDQDKLEAFLLRAQREWAAWDVKRHSGKWEQTPDVESVPGPLGGLGGLVGMGRKRKKDDDED